MKIQDGKSEWKNRIVAYGTKAAKEFLANPYNCFQNNPKKLRLSQRRFNVYHHKNF